MTGREAVVRPGGTMGMLVAGFYEVARPLYPVHLCATLEEAITWLGIGAEEAAWLTRRSEEERELGHRVNDVAYQMREHLAVHHQDATLASVARELKVPLRTLQRRLAEAGMRFDDELGRARLAAAKNLLLRSERDVKRIALDVGCASPSRLTQLFRAYEGTTPTAWRAIHRR